MAGRLKREVERCCMLLPLGRRAMDVISLHARLGSKLTCCSREYMSRLTFRSRKDLDDWITGEDGNQAGKRMWNDLVGILEKIEPGCIKRIS